MKAIELEQLLSELESLLHNLHEQQCNRALRIAQLKHSNLTREDLLNPDNFSDVISDPNFMYEDGLAAGILSAKMALRTHLISLLQEVAAARLPD